MDTPQQTLEHGLSAPGVFHAAHGYTPSNSERPVESGESSGLVGVGGASVLDMCCGPRMMWFDKDDARAIFHDRRRERHAMNRPKRGTVEWTETDPDILGDFTSLPFEDEAFWHVVFDPPHFERSGKIGFLAMKYGWLDGDWRKMIAAGFAEGFRVLKPGGTLIFKWTATENPVSEILKLTPMKPLYGHKSGKQAQTHWIAFLKGGGGAEPVREDADGTTREGYND